MQRPSFMTAYEAYCVTKPVLRLGAIEHGSEGVVMELFRHLSALIAEPDDPQLPLSFECTITISIVPYPCVYFSLVRSNA
jgi:hypothetical protein